MKDIAENAIKDNPLAYKASAAYLKSIKETFNKRDKKGNE